jgi:methionyl-tRNA synthetase
MNRLHYITTSIPYVNAAPHVGHAVEFVQADALSRYCRLRGGRVVFQTGTDENAFKNVLAAREAGVDVPTFVTENSRLFRDLADNLGCSYDTFIRTSEPRHAAGVHQLWRKLRLEDLYVKEYAGLYCHGCEDFYKEQDLMEGRCPDHGTEPEWVRERNYFFRLSAYAERLEELIESGTIEIVPRTRRAEVLSFIRGGLEDISVSRNAARSGGWGISVPDDPEQVIYVWIDALINYLSGQGYGTDDSWKRLWDGDACVEHVIGKNVWKFHAIYWPALLMSAGLPLPSRILVHGFLTAEGRKIGKSLGNAVDPSALIDEYGSDALRYYLLAGFSPWDDGDFSKARLQGVYDRDLANGIGNLAARLTTLCEKAGVVSLDFDALNGTGEQTHTQAVGMPAIITDLDEYFEQFRFDHAARRIIEEVGRLNRIIDTEKPWETLTGRHSARTARRIVEISGEFFRLSKWLEPFIPAGSAAIRSLFEARPIRKGPPVFPRLRRRAA